MACLQTEDYFGNVYNKGVDGEGIITANSWEGGGRAVVRWWCRTNCVKYLRSEICIRSVTWGWRVMAVRNRRQGVGSVICGKKGLRQMVLKVKKTAWTIGSNDARHAHMQTVTIPTYLQRRFQINVEAFAFFNFAELVLTIDFYVYDLEHKLSCMKCVAWSLFNFYGMTFCVLALTLICT